MTVAQLINWGGIPAALVLTSAPASAAEAQRTLIMQSLCTPTQGDSGFDPFGFELIQRGKDWSVRVYPVADARRPVPVMEVPGAHVSFVDSPTPGNVVIMASAQSSENGRRLTVNALSEIVANKPQPFSVDLVIQAAAGGAERQVVTSRCAFTNVDLPYERKPL